MSVVIPPVQRLRENVVLIGIENAWIPGKKYAASAQDRDQPKQYLHCRIDRSSSATIGHASIVLAWFTAGKRGEAYCVHRHVVALADHCAKLQRACRR